MAQPTQKLSPQVIFAFVCLYIFWGSTYVAIRLGVEVINPFVLASVRFFIAGPVMLLICALRGLKIALPLRDLGLLAFMGVLILGMGNMGLVWAEQYVPSGFSALLIAIIPIYVALLETVLPRGERLRSRGWAGIAAGFAGLVVLLSPGMRGHFSGSNRLLIGSAVEIAGAFAWTCGSIFSRRARLRTSPFVAAAWQMVFGGVFDLCMMFVFGGSWHGRWPAQAIWSVAWLIVFGSLVGYTAYIYLLEHVPVAKVSTYAYVNPIIAVILGTLLLHEKMAPIEYFGMAAVVIAVYLVTSSKMTSAKVAEVESVS